MSLTHDQVVAIIPARLGSTRFPGKVLAAETGKPLIQHVYEAARAARCLSRVVVATDDRRVAETVEGFGAEAVLTRADHPNGTSRLSEAGKILGLGDRDIVVNVQGDEPEVEPDAIEAAVRALIAGEGTAGKAGMVGAAPSIATIAVPFGLGENAADPNCVKVVMGMDGCALYFSRSLIPFDRDNKGGSDARPLRHVGLYVYRRAFLDRYVKLPSSPLERAEQLEQLRALENGFRIAVAVRARAKVGIDTPEQYREFVERWKRDRA